MEPRCTRGVDKVVDHFELRFDSENAKKGDVADWLLSVLVDPVSHSKTGASTHSPLEKG